MAEGRTRRQSRGQPKSYAINPLKDVLSDSELGEADEDDADDQQEEEDSDPDEFKPADAAEEEQDDADELNEEDENAEDEEAESIAAEEEVSRAESIVDMYSDNDSATSILPRQTKAKQSKRKVRPSLRTKSRGVAPSNVQAPSLLTKGAGTKIRQRGVEEWGKGGQENRYQSLFGPTHEDLIPVLKTRDRWSSQETLPCRRQGSLHRSFFVPEGARERELQSTRKWYTDAGKEAFAAAQVTRVLTEEEGRVYMINSGPESMNLIMGDIENPKLYEIDKGGYMSTSTPFDGKSARRGWLFNLGSRVQEAQWATNEEGRAQYLAVAVEQTQTIGRKHKPMENPKAPAYTATKSFPASIQIWVFNSTDNGDLDSLKPPRLEQVLCTDWGAPKMLRWWPIGAEDSVEPTAHGDSVRLGLLAGIWSDGRLRILDISHRRHESGVSNTQYTHYSQAAFDISFPDSIPTCVHWLSGTSLAATTTTGSLAVWTLTLPETFASSDADIFQTLKPQPWFYRQVADTYILSLSSGYPSRPYYISISTADGFARLIDLRSPVFDTCSSVRSRMLILAQAWHEQTQSFVVPDEYYMLKHCSIRRYYVNIYTMRIGCSITCCATSPVHPGVLIGGTDGVVVTSNPTVKALNTKEVPWQQTWFKHECRPPVEQLTVRIKDNQTPVEGQSDNINDVALTDPLASATPHDSASMPPASSTIPSELQVGGCMSALSQPLVRMTEGYKAHQVSMQYEEPFKRYKEGAKFITIFEAEAAISRLAWNPNLNFGTWAVAGMNSGLLRVEDLGV